VTAFDHKHIQSGPTIAASAFSLISDEVEKLDKGLLASSSFSMEVTSGEATLWTKYHSAQQHEEHRPGVTEVDGDSQYRIASITKVFTVLGLLYQHAAGNLSLDDTVDKYIPELREPDKGELPWKDITLRALASQL
jgi:CubicO group peptidase (beta-lactamase class C family)